MLFINFSLPAAAAAALLWWRRPNGSQHSHPRGASPLWCFGPGCPVSVHIQTQVTHAWKISVTSWLTSITVLLGVSGLIVLKWRISCNRNDITWRNVRWRSVLQSCNAWSRQSKGNVVFKRLISSQCVTSAALCLSVLPKWPECSASGLVPRTKCHRPAPPRTLTWDSWRHKEVPRYHSLLTSSTSTY